MFRAAASFSGVLHPLGEPRYWLGLFSNYTSDPNEVWGDPESDRATWRDHDPTALLPALRGIPLFVSAGDGQGAKRDAIETEVGAESRAFARRAQALKVPLHADLYPGGRHDWPYWQRELHRALPLLLAPLR